MSNRCPYCGNEYSTKQGLSQHTYGSHGGKSWIPREELVEMYHEYRWSTGQIAKEYDVTPKTILKTLDRYDIEKRETGEMVRQGLNMMPPKVYTEPRGYVVTTQRVSEDKHGKVYVHRLLAAAEYGIDAVEGMDVHHKNGVRWDNRPENIQLVDKQTHGRHHSNERWGNEAALD
jgi:hypothetical protein